MPGEYKYNIPPVPTVYKGRQYRSRLEAKWAAFFDLVGWQYEYEPCDLNGWFPDFAIYGKRLDGKETTILCEVKPIVAFDERTAERRRNALTGTYYQNSELLLLGSGPVRDGNGNRLHLGWLYEQPQGPWGAAVFRAYGIRSGATLTYTYGFAHKSGSFGDRITGHHQEGRQIAPIAPEDCGLESLNTLWQQAGNITQYKPPKTPQPIETPQPAPGSVVPPPVTTSYKKPPVNPEGPQKKKKAGIWIVSGVFIAAVITCGLLLTLKQPTPRSESWRGLMVAPEQRCAPYNRRDYPYPSSLEPRIVETLGNRIYSPYTKQVFTDLRQTNVEHIVALSEAHDSGLCAAPDSTRRAFAADLLNLTLASPKVNGCNQRGKCANDAAEWLPQHNRCWFAHRVVAVRRKYHLTIDRREADALDRVLAACPSPAMIGPEEGDPLTPASTLTLSRAETEAMIGPEEGDPLTLWDDNGNGRITCAEARRHGIAPVARSHPAYPFMRDGDGDGVVCE